MTRKIQSGSQKSGSQKSDREALKMAEKLLEYSRFNGKEKLSLVLSKTTDLLQEMVAQKQSRIDNFLLKT